MQKMEDTWIMKEFRRRQSRQIVAMTIALFLVLFAAVIHRRPDIFGDVSHRILFAAQAVTIVAFIGFTAVNWRCPSCGKHLGADIYRRTCRKCRARLQ